MQKINTKNLIKAFTFSLAICGSFFLFNSGAQAAQYEYVPTGGSLVVGTEANISGAVAAAAEGINRGSWKGTLTDDNFHWMPSSTASGINAQLDMDGVALNGANKFIIQTEIDTDATYNIVFQICDWTTATSVDAVADAQCTGGGWRSLNTQTAANADLAFTNGNAIALQWQIYNGYFTTGTTGGSTVATPLSNFIGAGGKVRIRYFTATNGGALAIDYLRLKALVDPTYNPGGFQNSGSGTPAGTYVNANYFGNIAAAALAGSDNVHMAVPGTAGTISDSYLIYKNIKTYTGMNTIYIRGEYGCSAATSNLRYNVAIRNFTSSTWENLGQPVDCAASNTDVVLPFAKNNVTISDYINGSTEIWVRHYGTINSTTALRTDWEYVTLGTTNTDAGTADLSYGTTTGGRVYSDPAPNNTDNINAVATDANYIYQAGFATVNQDSEWRLEKRDITTGALVTAFDSDGIVQNDPGTGADQITAIAVDTNYIYTAGFENSGNDNWRVEKRDKTTGALVTAFNSTGILTITPSANQDRIYAIWINATHIFLAGEDGTTSTADRRWRVDKRDITTGALVTAFDTDGILNTTNVSTGADVAYAITGDASYIYIGGTDITTGTTGQWRVEKRDITTGAVVTAFDTDGIVQRDPNTGALEAIQAIAVNATHLYVGGYDRASAATSDQWRVEKLDITTGALVTAFDTDGILNIAPSANQDRVQALALDATDIYIIGEDRTEATTTSRWRVEKRALSNGALTTAFNGDGIYYAQYNGHDRPLAASLQSTNLVIAGHGGGTSELWMTEKISSSTGLLDSSSFDVNDVTATRDLDITGERNIYRIQAEDESASSDNEFYAWDTDADATTEEAVALNLGFSVTVPVNAHVTGIYYGAHYNGGSAMTVQTAMRDYSGRRGVQGGWVNMGTAASTNMVLTEPVVTGGVTTSGPAGYMSTDPISYIDTVNNKMEMKIRTTTAAANNNIPVAEVDFMMVSFSWVEDANHPSVSYEFAPTSQNLVTGTSGAKNSILAAAGGGASIGSWKGALTDDNYHWSLTGTAGGFDAQLNLDGVQLNGANKIIIETEPDLDGAAAMKVQICDWVSTTSVDAVADAQCTGGGWRSLNSQNATNTDVNFAAATNGYSLQWHIYDGYWSTGTTGGDPVSTPLTNFVKDDSTKRVKVRYLSTLASATLDIDYLRIRPIIDSIYSPSDFVAVTGGVVSGTYASANIVGNTTTAQQTIAGSDNVKVSMAANAGAANEGYFVFRNVKTLTGMNTITVRAEYICGTTTGTVTPKIRNFTSGLWENLPAAGIACAAADATNGWAKNNITLSDYISGGEIWVDFAHNTANQTMAIDMVYIIVGSTNADTAQCQVTLGTGTATNCANTRTLDMTGTASTFDNPSEIESATMGTGDVNAFYGLDNESVPDAVADHATASNIFVPMTLDADANVVGMHYAFRFTSGGANATMQPALKDYSGHNAALGGWSNIGLAAANTATYSDSITQLAINSYGYHINAEDYLDDYNDRMNLRLRPTTNTTTTTAFTTTWDFAMASLQWIETKAKASLSGTCDAFDETTDCTDTGTIRVAVNGALRDQTQATVAGTWSISNVTMTSGDSIIVFIDGAADSDEAVAVTKYDGTGNIDNVRLYKEHVTIGTAGGLNSGQTITLANMDDYDVTNDEDVFFDVMTTSTCNGVGSFTGLCVDGSATSTTEELHILSGNTFAPAGNVLTHDMQIAGTFTGSSDTYRASGSWTDTGTFTPSTSTTVFSATAAGETITTTGSSFNNLTFDGVSGGWTLLDSTEVGGVLTITNGDFNAGTGTTVTLSGTGGNPFVNNGTFTPGTSTFAYTGNNAGGNTIVENIPFHNLTINNGAEIYDLSGATTVLNNLNITAGALDAVNGQNYGLTIGKDFVNNGTFTPRIGTVTFNNSSNVSIVDGPITFYNFTVTTAAKTIQFMAGETFVVNGVLTATGTNGSNVVFNSTTGSSTWTINHQGTESITYLTVNWGACDGGSTVITMGTGSTKDGNSGACWTVSGSGVTISGVVYQSDGSTPDATGYTLSLSDGGGVGPTAVSNGSGVFTFDGVSAPTNGNIITIWISGGSGTLVFKYGASCTGTPNCTGLAVVKDHVRLQSFDGNAIANSDLSSCDNNDGGFGCNASDIGFDSDGTDLIVNDAYSLTIPVGTTFAPAGAVTVKNLNILGTVTAPSATISIKRDLNNTGTLTASVGTFAFIDSNLTSNISGSNTFNNLSVTAAGKVVNFAAGTTTTVNGVLTATGVEGSPVIFNSTTGSSSWTINHQGTESISYLTVSWSACHGSSTDISLTTTSNNGGNNGACWKFIVASAGTNSGGSGGGAGAGGAGQGGGGVDGGGATAQATAIANMGGGIVETISMVDNGSGYTTIPIVCVQGGGFSVQATATAVLSGGIVISITVNNGGSGYQTTPTIGISAPPGEGAACSGGGGGGQGGGGGGAAP